MGEDKSLTDKKVIIEKPIEHTKDDEFNVIPYVEQLKEAIHEGARFIAIDGKYGSGKSSIFQLLKKELEAENKNSKKQKNYIVEVNFLNINQDYNISKVTTEKSTQEEMIKKQQRSIVDNYHRYFVSQVANDICKNPYSVEKLFYHNYFSYSNNNIKRDTLDKKIVDGLLLGIVILLGLYLSISPFKDNIIIKELYNIATIFVPYLLYVAFILILLYGYGVYKPDKSEKSPMLDIDKSRNNFCKVIFDNLNENDNLYLIIDDLDRITIEDIQLKIISLLYNEYYPLNKVIKNINIKFIFMLDTSNYSNEEVEKVNANKLFDYILYVSSNQKTLLTDYVKEQIEENKYLSIIFNGSEYKNYLIGLIINNYNSIRDIKHFLNRIITKYIYLSSKEDIKIKTDELVIMNFLLDRYPNQFNAICEDIEKIITQKSSVTYSENYKQYVKEAYDKDILDSNYYMYIYSFKNKDNLLSITEQNIITLISEKSINEEKIKLIDELIDNENTDLLKIYDNCFIYLPNQNKHILLGNKKFADFYIKKNNINNRNLWLNSYKFKSIYKSYRNMLHFNVKTDIIIDYMIDNINQCLKALKESNNDANYYALKNEMVMLINNLKEQILNLDLKGVFNFLELDDELYELLNSIIILDNKDTTLLYELYRIDYLSFDKIKPYLSKNFIIDINSKANAISFEIGKKLLDNDLDFVSRVKILKNEEQKFDDIEKQYEILNNQSGNMYYDTLVKIVDKYGYSPLLDKYFTHLFNQHETKLKLFAYIRKNQFNLSRELTTLISPQKEYNYSEHYDKLFLKYEMYENYIYSSILKKQAFVLDKNSSLNRKPEYAEAIYNVFKNMTIKYKPYDISKGIINVIQSKFNEMQFNNENFWKITKVSKFLNSEKVFNDFFNMILQQKQLENFCKYYYNHYKDFKDIGFNNNLRAYVSSQDIKPSIKGLVTKAIRKMNNHR